MAEPITLEDIRAARDRIAAQIVPLRISRSTSLSQKFERDILLAHEYQQTTGAFKLRGAMNAVLQLPPDTSGVTAVSTASHGRHSDKPGIRRKLATCSTGEWVGPSSPRPMES